MPDVMDEAGELCELLGWVGKEGAAKLSDVAAIVAFATRREAAARREERVMSDKPDFAAADEIAGQVVESATDDDLRGTMLYTIARAYQAARREIERLTNVLEVSEAANRAKTEHMVDMEAALLAAQAQARRDAEAAINSRPYWQVVLSRCRREFEMRESMKAHPLRNTHVNDVPVVAADLYCEAWDKGYQAALAARKEPGHGS